MTEDVTYVDIRLKSMHHSKMCLNGMLWYKWDLNIDGLVQDCSNSSELAMELLQPCTKPSICGVCHSIWLMVRIDKARKNVIETVGSLNY